MRDTLFCMLCRVVVRSYSKLKKRESKTSFFISSFFLMSRMQGTRAACLPVSIFDSPLVITETTCCK